MAATDVTPLSDTPQVGDWLIEEVPGPREPTTPPLRVFRLWTMGSEATGADQRAFASWEQAQGSLIRRAQRDHVDAWRVSSDDATVLGRFRPDGGL